MDYLSPMSRKALEYIHNAGGTPEVRWFDDDHEPIGPQLRDDLLKAGMVEIIAGFDDEDIIVLTKAGTNELR